MRLITLTQPDDFDAWRDAARVLAADNVPPDDVVWQLGDDATDLFAPHAAPTPAAPATVRPFSVPRAFIDLARKVILANVPERFSLLYTLLFRLRREPKLMDDQADPLVRRLERLAKEVRRDIHKMRAFLRFREVEDADGPRFVAWFEPEHHIVRANA
ncbi:MAG: DUF4130 domain-containing protein, partial [Pseudomonadota bacterium]